MSSSPAEPGEMLTANANASQKSAADCRALTLDTAAMALKYRPFLKAIAAAEFPDHLQSRIDDSDLVQETLLRATQNIDQFRGNTEPELEAWLRESLLNQLRDCVRFHSRQQRDVAREFVATDYRVCCGDVTPSEQFRTMETQERLWKVVGELPDDYRTVILLRQQKDLTFVEIAEQMQRTPDAVRMLWGRAIIVLGEKLKSLKLS
jgi:RNA polymerase sigma-70 factor (ECF subfamily)